MKFFIEICPLCPLECMFLGRFGSDPGYLSHLHMVLRGGIGLDRSFHLRAGGQVYWQDSEALRRGRLIGDSTWLPPLRPRIAFVRTLPVSWNRSSSNRVHAQSTLRLPMKGQDSR